LRTYKSLTSIRFREGKEVELLKGDDEAYFMLPKASPSGDRQCFADTYFQLVCHDPKGFDQVWPANADGPIKFDSEGLRLMFTARRMKRGTSKNVVANFETRTLTLLPTAGKEWWEFLPGGRRIAGHGGEAGAVLYDLKSNTRHQIGDKKSEWEGMWVFPNRDDRVIIGRERRGTRDLYLVELSK
jgi:hypothetical protein